MNHLFGLTYLAVVSHLSVAHVMQSFITPVTTMLIPLAVLVCAGFLVYGGMLYTASSGSPDKLEHAKVVIRSALIGLVIVIAAGTLTAILVHTYNASSASTVEKLPALVSISPAPATSGLVDVLLTSITGLLKVLIESAAKPFLDALTFFTRATPLMADNSSVLNLWIVIVGMTDALFVLVITLLGFRVMSYAAFGLEEIELKHLLPQTLLVFLLVNTSIFAIDGIISLSNAMIAALNVVIPAGSVWDTLSAVVAQPGAMGLMALLMMVAFLVLSVMLMIYYVLRLVTLYLGAVLAPLAILLWLVPGFKDFVETATKAYLGTIFVLFIHVVILALASSLFAGMVQATPDHSLNPFMSLVVGLATLLALLKTQAVMSQMSYVSLGPRTATKLGGQLSNVMSYYGSKSVRAVSGYGSDSLRRASRHIRPVAAAPQTGLAPTSSKGDTP